MLKPPTKATDKLLADHQLIRRALLKLHFENPEYDHALKTCHRVVVAHAWFEDVIFLPAFEREPLLERRFVQEVIQEHQDIHTLFGLLKAQPGAERKQLDAWMVQLRVILDTHFAKEENGLFPLAERILDSEGLNRLGAEMDRRKTEVRNLVD